MWFCPGLPPHVAARSRARVTFANIGATDADVVVTVLPDKGAAKQVTIPLAANTVVTRPRDSLGAPGALTVETFGGRVLVEEGIKGAQALETDAVRDPDVDALVLRGGHDAAWCRAVGRDRQPVRVRRQGRRDAADEQGVLRPDAVQSLDISRRSRAVIPIHDLAVRKDRVAVEVAASLGSVVAAQTLVYTATAGTPGVALSMGSPVAGSDWTFAGATAQPASTAVVAIANVGDDDAHVDVQATAETSKQALASASVTRRPDDVMWLLLGQCRADRRRPRREPVA